MSAAEIEVASNGLEPGHQPLVRSWTLENGQPTREDLIKMVRESGLPVSTAKSVPSSCYSEPSSPRKVLRRINGNNSNDKGDGSSTNSSSTLTSEDGVVNELPDFFDKDSTLTRLSELPPSVEDNTDFECGEFRKRSGSRFYHESFAPAPTSLKPVLYIPASRSAHQLSQSAEKKKRSLLARIRRSFRSRHRASTSSRAVSDKATPHGKRWIDYEEELDPVSRPSYFRHIGHVVAAGPGIIKTIELNKPAHGKFGVYIVQGVDPSCTDRKSIFVSRFYQENMSMFYLSLLQPGDEILAVNGAVVRDLPITKVVAMLESCDTTVQLTILPSAVSIDV